MTANTRLPSAIILLAAALVCAGCVTETSESERGSFVGGMKRQPAPKEADDRPAPSREPAAAASAPPAPEASARPAEPAPRRTAAPPTGRSPDTRVMLYQPKGDLLLILVNESHSGRASEEGRIALALGDPNRAYKILSDSQMEALLKSLAGAGYDANSAEFVPDDAQYMTASSADLPRYQGLISVERGGVKTKVLGFRKSSEGDAMGARRYQTYAMLKGLVQKWFGDSSRSEFPVGGVSLPPSKGS
jgi:hypothetical protein